MAINAGVAETVATGRTVLLWATTSTGSVTWTQTLGPAVTLAGSGAQRWFTPTVPGTYSFSASNGTDTGSKQVVAVGQAAATTTGGGSGDTVTAPSAAALNTLMGA